MDSKTNPPRLVSLDQFRGYSVAAMFVVNFLGGLGATHVLLKHNNTHFSLADSIMPSFIFACGFSYRMSSLKQANAQRSFRSKIFVRCIALIALSLFLTGFNSQFGNWNYLDASKVSKFFFELIKANMWEILAIIGACQIFLLPWITRPFAWRLALFFALGLLHFYLCWAFNYDYVYGRPNFLDRWLGTTGKRAWDGGLFGLLAWSQIMLVGTLAHDLLKHGVMAKSVISFGVLGIAMMMVGYGLSCFTRLYDLEGLSEEQVAILSSSPVIPQPIDDATHSFQWKWAEPPFVVPPSPQVRAINYWMMDKRIVSQTFIWFSIGFVLVLYAAFVVACDHFALRLGMFAIFGANPLAAYITNQIINHAVLAVVPKDSPLWWALLGLAIAFGMTYLFIRFLDKQKIFLRL
ncbi:MAG: hypothetical protein U0905_17080 [Pirellulales bacterium]